MSAFLFSAFFGLLVHQLLSIIQVDWTFGYRRVHVGRRITIRMPERIFIAFRATLLTTAIVVFIILMLILVTQQIHPEQGYAYRFGDALASPRVPSALFGIIVGILTGNMLNRLLRGKIGAAFTSRDWLEVILIFFLFIMGVGGEEALRSYSGRISEISIGATSKIAFSDSSAPATRRAPEQTSNASRPAGDKGGDYASSGESTGLQRAGLVSDTAAKDRRYLALFEKLEGRPPPVANTAPWPDAIERATRTMIYPFASCLDGIFGRTANSSYVDDRLAPLVDLFQNLKADATLEARSNLVRAFGQQIRQVGDKAYDLFLDKYLNNRGGPVDEELLTACSAIVALLCASDQPGAGHPWEDESSSKWLADNKKSAAICMAERFGSNGKKPATGGDDKKPPADPYELRDKAIFQASVAQLSVRDELTERPYLAIIFASFAAQLGHYVTASSILDEWIHSMRNAGTFPDKWYVIRARFVLAVYMEEWIRQKGENAEPALRRYHIKNLEKIIFAMDGFQSKRIAKTINGEGRFDPGVFFATYSGDDDVCVLGGNEEVKSLTAAEIKLLSDFYLSYITAKISAVNHSLRHSEAARSNAATISISVKELTQTSFKCLSLTHEAKAENRAAILELFARNQLNIVENTTSLKDKDSLRDQLKIAQRVARLAAQTVYQRQDAEKKNKDDDDNNLKFNDRITTSPTIETYEKILVTQSRIKNAERELNQ
jgi:hypothetical protein